MKLRILVLLSSCLLSACIGPSTHTDDPTELFEADEHAQAAEPTQEHRWLHQLVGQWRVRSEAWMGSDAPPLRMESTERVRAIGGLWVLAEGNAAFTSGPFTSVLTLGYDPLEQRFVGTWVDTIQTHLWTYRGTLDAAKRTLTLETEGPGFEDPSQTSRYRDTIEILDGDHRRLTSSVLTPSGEWTTFLRAESTRVK